MDIILGLAVVALAAIAVVLLFFNQNRTFKQKLSSLQKELGQAREEGQRLKQEGENAQTNLFGLRVEVAEERGARTQAELRVKQLSEELSAEQKRQKQSLIDANAFTEKLAPLQGEVKKLYETIDRLKTQQSLTQGRLETQLNEARSVNEKLMTQTQILSQTMRSTHEAGVWGELRLEDILSSSGLIENQDYWLQKTLKFEDSTLRPDALVRLPGDKRLVIDAKAPCENYLAAARLQTEGASGSAVKEQLRKHSLAVKSHIDALNKRDYHNKTPQAVPVTILFLPQEGLLKSAMEADPQLINYALNKKVVLSSPINLWTLLQTVSFVARQQKLNDQAHKIIELGQTLVNRIVKVAEHTSRLGAGLSACMKNYNQLVGSLERNLLSTARKLDSGPQKYPDFEERENLLAREFSSEEIRNQLETNRED